MCDLLLKPSKIRNNTSNHSDSSHIHTHLHTTVNYSELRLIICTWIETQQQYMHQQDVCFLGALSTIINDNNDYKNKNDNIINNHRKSWFFHHINQYDINERNMYKHKPDITCNCVEKSSRPDGKCWTLSRFRLHTYLHFTVATNLMKRPFFLFHIEY